MDSSAGEVSIIENDLPCVHCDYNLRTLAIDSTCPECGKPVADALGEPLHIAQTRRINATAFGVWWLALGLAGYGLTLLAAMTDMLASVGDVRFILPWVIAAAWALPVLGRIRAARLRYGAFILYALVVAAYAQANIFIWMQSFRRPWYIEHAPQIYTVIGCLFLLRPLAHEPRRWFRLLLAAMGLYVTLRGAVVMSAETGLLGSGVELWARLTAAASGGLFVTLVVLHLSDMAQQVRAVRLVRWGRSMSYAMAGAVALWMVVGYFVRLLVAYFQMLPPGPARQWWWWLWNANHIALAIVQIGAALFAGMLALHLDHAVKARG